MNVCKNCKYSIMIELTFLKVLMLINKYIKKVQYLPLFVFFAHMQCNHYFLMMFINLNDIAILNLRGVDYHCGINGISKSDSVKRNIIKIKIIMQQREKKNILQLSHITQVISMISLKFTNLN